MRKNAPESAPEGHGRAPRADLQYLRASTDRQGVSGLGLEAQRETFDRHIRAAWRKLPSEHIEVESGKNNDRQQLQPCHWARLARNQVRFGLRQAAQCGGAAANASGERRPGQAAASEPSQAPPGLAGIGPKASRLPPPPWVLATPEAIRAGRARRLGSRWRNFSVVVVDPPL